ncbi:mechanosensitive ion channel family protein [bacterium]|nr:mechanosensitive ion channel family protein [bacterium]
MDGETTYMDTMMQWLVENGADFAVKLLAALLILLVGKIIIGIVISVLRKSLQKAGKFNDLQLAFLLNISSKALWIFVWVIVLAQLGIAVGPMIAGLGVAGFIFGFAFQDTLGNFAAGIMILLNDPFQPGHYVEVAGHAGVVKEVHLMATTLTTPDNKRITIPNGGIWGTSIVNYSAMDTRRVDMTVGISYSADIDKAQKIVRQVLDSNAQVLKDPAPTIEVVEMADSSVNLVVRPWVNTADYWAVFFATQKAVKQAFDAEDIEIPFPQVVVHKADA